MQTIREQLKQAMKDARIEVCPVARFTTDAGTFAVYADNDSRLDSTEAARDFRFYDGLELSMLWTDIKPSILYKR